MKIREGKYSLRKEPQEFTIKEAIVNASIADVYSYEGQLEKLSIENEKLRELVARLVECIYDKDGTSEVDQLSYILGYVYEVEE